MVARSRNVYSQWTCFSLGSSPYVVDVSSFSSGTHNITFNAIVNGVVRGSATQSFLVSEGVV